MCTNTNVNSGKQICVRMNINECRSTRLSINIHIFSCWEMFKLIHFDSHSFIFIHIHSNPFNFIHINLSNYKWSNVHPGAPMRHHIESSSALIWSHLIISDISNFLIFHSLYMFFSTNFQTADEKFSIFFQSFNIVLIWFSKKSKISH